MTTRTFLVEKRIFLENCDIRDSLGVLSLFSKHKFDYIFHLAAQSFPHVSFTNPLETPQTIPFQVPSHSSGV